MMKKLIAVCGMMVVLAFSSVLFADTAYTITDLGTLNGGGSTYARGINNNGQVVGYAYVNPLNYHAFIWDSENLMQDLGTLGGSNSEALGINDNGQVVGKTYNSSEYNRAFNQAPHSTSGQSPFAGCMATYPGFSAPPGHVRWRSASLKRWLRGRVFRVADPCKSVVSLSPGPDTGELQCGGGRSETRRWAYSV